MVVGAAYPPGLLPALGVNDALAVGGTGLVGGSRPSKRRTTVLLWCKSSTVSVNTRTTRP
jgi:hypothetical protein